MNACTQRLSRAWGATWALPFGALVNALAAAWIGTTATLRGQSAWDVPEASLAASRRLGLIVAVLSAPLVPLVRFVYFLLRPLATRRGGAPAGASNRHPPAGSVPPPRWHAL